MTTLIVIAVTAAVFLFGLLVGMTCETGRRLRDDRRKHRLCWELARERADLAEERLALAEQRHRATLARTVARAANTR